MLARKLYYLHKVQKQQWMKPKELEDLQRKKLRAVIKYAFRFVPYYRKKWKAVGVRDDDIKTVEDLKKLPIITKKDVVKNFNQFIAVNYRKAYKLEEVVVKFTSGSSGSPLGMIFDKNAWDYLDAVYLRSLLAAGYNPRKPLAYYWYEPFKGGAYNRFGFMNKIYIPCKSSEDEQLSVLQRSAPEYIYYFPSILHSISKKIIHDEIELRPKSVITHAEVLSKKMKKTIQEAFCAPVYDQYGTNEFNRVAWECGEGMGYHIDTDSVVLEILSDENKNEYGPVALTGLVNFILPLIRYKIGDAAIATDERCACGRGLPLLKSIEGRISDIVTLKSGRVFTPRQIIDAVADVAGIHKFKISYKRFNKFNIKLLVFEDPEKVCNLIEKRLRVLFKEKVKIKSNIAREIKPKKRGKLKLLEVVK